jgi:hypothetical protein
VVGEEVAHHAVDSHSNTHACDGVVLAHGLGGAIGLDLVGSTGITIIC